MSTENEGIFDCVKVGIVTVGTFYGAWMGLCIVYYYVTGFINLSMFWK